MSYPINYPTPQGANVQMFTGYDAGASSSTRDWVKPQGASFVWFTLIGPGASGNGTTGGGSGAVTNFMCPAFLIPDRLTVNVGTSDSVETQIKYQQKTGSGYTLLFANPAIGSAGGTAMTANYFTAMGFFQSIAGQAGTAGSVSASTTTFLSGGGVLGGTTVTANYGYSTQFAGFFQLQPIIVGCGATGTNNPGGIGCGGSYTTAAQKNGGSGMVVIITW